MKKIITFTILYILCLPWVMFGLTEAEKEAMSQAQESDQEIIKAQQEVIKEYNQEIKNFEYIDKAQQEADSRINDAYDKFLNEPTDANQMNYDNAKLERAKLDTEEWQAAAIKKAEDKIAADKAAAEAAAKREIDPNNLAWSNFQLDVNSLTPGENKYSWWAKENINSIINKITKVLLLVIPSLAVLFIVYGAIKIILAWWDSSKVGTGKTIIQFNIIAVVLALLSYSIIQLVIWLLGWNI